jgi:nitrite reductase (NADH) small subunit
MSDWVTVGRAADVPLLEGRSARLGGGRIAVFRLADGWAALDHACPHKAGPLSDGIVADACVTCPLHNWRFDLRTGERVGGEGGVQAYDVREVDGLLQVAVGFAAGREHVAERRDHRACDQAA